MSLPGRGLVTVESLHSVRFVARSHAFLSRIERILQTEIRFLPGLVLVISIRGDPGTLGPSLMVDEDRLTEHDSDRAGDLAPTGPGARRGLSSK